METSPENAGRVRESRIFDSRILEKAEAFSGRNVIMAGPPSPEAMADRWWRAIVEYWNNGKRCGRPIWASLLDLKFNIYNYIIPLIHQSNIDSPRWRGSLSVRRSLQGEGGRSVPQGFVELVTLLCFAISGSSFPIFQYSI